MFYDLHFIYDYRTNSSDSILLILSAGYLKCYLTLFRTLRYICPTDSLLSNTG